MIAARQLFACLALFLILLIPAADLTSALPPLAAGTFPVGTIIVPMDNKQADRVHVYGFIHEFLRLISWADLARVIEPPDVTLHTSLNPSGDLYQGGPFLIDSKFASGISSMHAMNLFSKVIYTTLTAPFTSNKIFFVRQPTRILVIRGVYGRTDLTLSRMGVNYTIVDPDTVGANPSIINQYSLIVVDCPGWYGTPATITRYSVTSIYDIIRTHVQAGNEVIFTDIALKDMNQTFPGYINLAQGDGGSWQGTVYNPSKGDNFPGEFPSQYYNPQPNPNSVTIFTEGGGYVVSSITPQHASDVRILMDSNKFGVPFRYAILGFYFQFGNGIVEGIAFHPYEQLYPNYADQNGYYATYEIYGNKFVHGPQLDFLLSATPLAQPVTQGQSAIYTVTVTSLGSFTSTVNLQVSGGLPPGAQPNIVPPSLNPSSGGSLSSALTISTAADTPTGTYNVTITGTSTLPLITHSVVVTLVVTVPPSNFKIQASPVPLVVNQGQCGNITVTVTSLGNFSSPVNLTLTGLPSHVSARYLLNPVTPPVGGSKLSFLTLCPESAATPGNYTMTIFGTSGTLVHSSGIQVNIPPPPAGPPVNFLIILFILAMLLLAIGLGLLAVLLSRKRPARLRPRAVYVLPLPTIRCRNCGRIIPLPAVYCPYCGRPQVILTPRPARIVRPARRLSRSGIIAVCLSIVSGILVILNSALLLVPSFYASWASIFFWLPAIGHTYAFALGVIIGLTLIFGSVVMVLGNGALADVIIFPFAVFSLIIGGGFVAGFIIGVLAGIIGALRR
jgi:hypothetical protein